MRTAQSDVGSLVRVVLKHPRDSFVSQAAIDSQWRALNFSEAPDFLAACHEFDQFVRLLEDNGASVELLPSDRRTGLDSIYVRDASIATDGGIVLCNMDKPLRAGEPAAQGDEFAQLGLTILGSITAPGTVEGGDVAWLDRRTLAVGQGYRTNAEGIRQLRGLLGTLIDELIVVPLPHWRGAGDVMHLMSLISPVAKRTAAVYSPLLPVPFRTALVDAGYVLVEVPAEEFDSMGTNVLTVSPGTVVTLEGNARTRAALEAQGIRVLTYRGAEISVKGAGGPTCLTRPLMRM